MIKTSSSPPSPHGFARNLQTRLQRVAITVVIFGLSPFAAVAQQGAPVIEGATLINPTPDGGQYLGNVYKDEVAGFKMAPPVNARVISKAGSYDLLTFIQDSKSSGGTLQRIDTTIALKDYVDNALSEMKKSFKAVQVQENRLTKFQGFNAIRLSTTLQAELGTGLPTGFEQQIRGGARPARNEEVALLRQQLIVQTRENGFMVLTYYTPLKDREEAVRTFEAMVGSFEILNQTDLKKRRVEAIMAGKTWLAERTAEEFKAKMNPQRVMYKMLVGGMNGTEVGYIGFDEREAARDGFRGIEIEMGSRSFPDAGTLILGKNVSFWAFSRSEKGEKLSHYSMWDNASRTDVRLPMVNNPTKLELKKFWIEESGALTLESDPRFTEEAIRDLERQRQAIIAANPNRPPPPPINVAAKQFRIMVNLSGDKTQRLPDGIVKLIPPQEAAPLPKVFEYMWPRMVDLTKPSEMSFAVFNSSAKKLDLRHLVVTGKKERVPVNGRWHDLWKCVDELDPGSTTLWVDDTGRIVVMRTSDQSVMLPTTEQEMERRWGARLREWQQQQ